MRREDEYEIQARRKKKYSKKYKKRRQRRIIVFAIEALLLLLVLAGVYVVTIHGKLQKSDFSKLDVEKNELSEDVEEAMTGFTTYALFGVDARDNQTLGKGTHGDVVMVASVNNATGEVKLASIYRDTYLCISDDNKTYGKMTTAFFNGGPLSAINTLNRNFDLNINEYVAFNWAAVAVAINDLGGIEIDVPESMYKDQMFNGYTTLTAEATGINSRLSEGPGYQWVDGIQAVAYCRIRYVAGNDYGRTARQREVANLILEKAKKADVLTLNKIANDVFPNISTSLSLKEILSLAPKVGSFTLGEESGFPGEDMRANVSIDGGDMVVPNSLEDTARELHKFLYGNENYKPSATVKQFSTQIQKKIK